MPADLVHTRRNQAGMTLIEVLTVVFIIALTSSLVVLTLPQRESDAERFAKRFSHDVSRAHDRAILSGRVVGIGFEEDHYQVQEWRGGVWAPINRQTQRLPDKLDVTLLQTAIPSPEGLVRPDILFDPTGVGTPVEMAIRARGERLSLIVNPDGTVQTDVR